MATTRENEAALVAAGWVLVDLQARIETGGAVLWQATIARHDGSDSTHLINTDEGALLEECLRHAQTHPVRGRGGAS